MRERLDEFHKMVLQVINQDALTASWMNSLTHSPYSGWQPGAKVPLQEITSDQKFYIAPSSLRFIEYKDKALVPCDHGVLRFPVNLSPVLHRLASATTSFTIPEVLSWQPRAGGPSPDEIIDCLQNLYTNGILRTA